MTDGERAALVGRLRIQVHGSSNEAADLIEADGKRLALAETAPHSPGCYSLIDSSLSYCTCWKAEYDAAKAAL